eukprot:TRINITY_DN11560_c0_g1_i1.p1 TRINITY_DN11560_c0_g1~~TRINITY_DN11560_c0_g1_i1.p1  ORF type:complete len:265 (-),score=55.66 TRINITY_DN11560_c0_g1_i1:55-753(-)
MQNANQRMDVVLGTTTANQPIDPVTTTDDQQIPPIIAIPSTGSNVNDEPSQSVDLPMVDCDEPIDGSKVDSSEGAGNNIDGEHGCLPEFPVEHENILPTPGFAPWDNVENDDSKDKDEPSDAFGDFMQIASKLNSINVLKRKYWNYTILLLAIVVQFSNYYGIENIILPFLIIHVSIELFIKSQSMSGTSKILAIGLYMYQLIRDMIMFLFISILIAGTKNFFFSQINYQLQ